MAAYEWGCEEAARRRLYLKRFLRADDPSGWPDLLGRIGTQGMGATPRVRRQQDRIARLAGHLDAIRAGCGTAEDWLAAACVVDEMAGDAVPPNDRRVRDLLPPVLDRLPDLGDLAAGFGLTLRAIDRYLANRPTTTEITPSDVPTSQAAEVAGLLKGKSVGKPMVRSPGGDGVNPVAARTLAWCGGRLGRDDSSLVV